MLSDNQTSTSNDVTGKIALNWRASRENFFYAFVATGFKAGGLNVPVGLGTPAAFGPEKVTEYEGGWKSTLFDGRLKTQIDGYYNDYKNFQVTVGYPNIPTFGFELNDPRKTTIYGFEASTQGNFGALSVDASLGLLHSSLGGFYASNPLIPLSLRAIRPLVRVPPPARTWPDVTSRMRPILPTASAARTPSTSRMVTLLSPGSTSATSRGNGRRCSKTSRSAIVWDRGISWGRSWPGPMATSSRRSTAPI